MPDELKERIKKAIRNHRKMGHSKRDAIEKTSEIFQQANSDYIEHAADQIYKKKKSPKKVPETQGQKKDPEMMEGNAKKILKKKDIVPHKIREPKNAGGDGLEDKENSSQGNGENIIEKSAQGVEKIVEEMKEKDSMEDRIDLLEQKIKNVEDDETKDWLRKWKSDLKNQGEVGGERASVFRKDHVYKKFNKFNRRISNATSVEELNKIIKDIQKAFEGEKTTYPQKDYMDKLLMRANKKKRRLQESSVSEALYSPVDNEGNIKKGGFLTDRGLSGKAGSALKKIAGAPKRGWSKFHTGMDSDGPEGKCPRCGSKNIDKVENLEESDLKEIRYHS